ncbi:MAG: DUF4827 domain-containing protein [Candidatus Symbiothrix sp.]|jgi:hypothetical protein|nr:DUF4827 domain-containing protein [Candidatus Symbiothrix sp.]
MKVKFFLILSITGLSLAISSCNDAKTAQEYLREEKKAIERYIDTQGIKVVSDYLQAFESGKTGFAENSYFLTKEGLYIHVVDSGNGKRAEMLSEILTRFDYYFDVKTYVSGDTSRYSVSYLLLPIEFKYGMGTYTGYYACNGWAIPLSYMGEDAVVDLIIPSSLGSQSDNSSYRPVFYKNLHYTKFR